MYFSIKFIQIGIAEEAKDQWRQKLTTSLLCLLASATKGLMSAMSEAFAWQMKEEFIFAPFTYPIPENLINFKLKRKIG